MLDNGFDKTMELLCGKDNKTAYECVKEIRAASAASDEYYRSFDFFASLLSSEKTYVRTRGFILCCAQARWDTEGKIRDAFPSMRLLLNDEKPTAVRQCLAALKNVVIYRDELSDMIRQAVSDIDISRYRDSMAPLIKKDVEVILEMTKTEKK